jgi:hypothetical protein
MWVDMLVSTSSNSESYIWPDKNLPKESSNSPKPKKKGETHEKQSSFSLTSRGLYTNNSAWQAKQSTLHITETFYGDCMKICEDFAPNFGNKRTSCSIMTMHHFTLPFSPRNFLPEITWLSSPPTYFFLILRLKIKLRGRHFDAVEVIKAESGGAEHPHITQLPGCI